MTKPKHQEKTIKKNRIKKHQKKILNQNQKKATKKLIRKKTQLVPHKDIDPSQVEPLKLNILGEYESIDLDRNHMHVMCTIQAPVAKIERAPIDLVCVVDKSGSMAGEKLKLVKEACSFIVQELQDGDHFCLISYDDRIDVEFDIAEMKKKK